MMGMFEFHQIPVKRTQPLAQLQKLLTIRDGQSAWL
jgi:hypothetical protein